MTDPTTPRSPRTEAGKRLLAEMTYDRDPEHYLPGDYFERYRDAILAIEDEGLDVERLARAFYVVTQGRFAVSDLMPTLPDWRDPSIDAAVWDKAVADGAEIAAEYIRLRENTDV